MGSRIATFIVLSSVALVLFLSCSSPSDPTPQPSPTPTAQPTPEPWYPMSALRAQGSQLVDDDGPVSLLGCIACCEDAKANDWPWASVEFMAQCAAHGGRYTEFRNGPNNGSEGPEFDAYLRMPDGRYDLTKWNPAFWANLHERLDAAERLGMFVGVEVVDRWVLRRRLSPWQKDRNVQGFEGEDPFIASTVPKTYHRDWIRKVAIEAGRHRNVVFLTGNEAFLPPGAAGLPFEEGMVDIIRQVEAEKGYVRHLVGSNTHDPKIERSPKIDIVIRHADVHIPGPVYGKPAMVNEVNPHSFQQFSREARAAMAVGTLWQLWRGDMKAAEYQQALDELKAIQEGK